jgi:hypothetical protein
MSSRARILTALTVSAILAIGLAAGSVTVHRAVQMTVGNMCPVTPDNPAGLCVDGLPAGGWPFAFLYDNPGTSVRGNLGVEDDFRMGWFLLNAAVLGLLPALSAVLVARRRRPTTAIQGEADVDRVDRLRVLTV